MEIHILNGTCILDNLIFNRMVTNMRKILSLILCSALIFTLTACGQTKVKDDSVSNNVVKENSQGTKEEVVAKSTEETKVEAKDASNVKTTEESKEVKSEEIKSREVSLYFSDDQAMYLVGEKRSLKNPTAKSIVEELVKGPSAKSTGTTKLYATLPVDLEVIDVLVKEKIAYVDFKGNVTQKMQGGSSGEGMALFSIINTLILDKELGITKVQFLVDGQKVDSIKGHYDVSQPMSEDKEMIKK